jgi:uncharacterized protein
MSFRSGIYAGDVIHTRLRPRQHRLRYRVFSVLLDLDELETLDGALRLFSVNRRGLFSFRDSDHGSGDKGGLKDWVSGQLGSAGVETDDLRVTMLCYPRILGYVFNPLTVYFCYGPADDLRAVVYEVCNTFHERHAYVIPVTGGQGTRITHDCGKDLYVSPFVPMDCHYHFSLDPPADKVRVAITESDQEGTLLYAAFRGARRPLTDRELARAFVRYPLMTLKVTAAIHWEALRLFIKRVPVHRHARARNPRSTTIVANAHRPEPR